MIIGHKLIDEDIKNIKNFIDKYYYLYPNYLQEEIDNKIMLGFTNNNDTINQIYCYLNIDDKEINPYIYFYNYIVSKFGSNNNILEVGSGTIPILAKYFDKNKITLMDKLLIDEFYKDYNYLKESFDENTNIEKYDLIIGYNPCGATENIIKNAIKNNKDFCIALCGCCFLPKEYNERTTDNWHKYLYQLANELSNNEYEISLNYFDKNYCIDWPIITGKRVK